MKQILKHLTTVALLCMLPLFTANAQLARFYTTENSLPNSKVNQIYQDSRGFVWISTENGLARFDGRDFLTFRYRRDKADALASDLVLSVFEDSSGTLWTGTSMGLQVFDPDNRSFRLVDLQDPGYPGSTQHISSILEVKTGNGTSELWVATSQHGVYIIDPRTQSLKGSRRALLNRNLPSPFVYDMFQDSRGWVWLAGETGGLSVVDSQTLQGQGITLDPQTFIRDFAEDPSSGNILVATMDGLYIYQAASHTLSLSRDTLRGKFSGGTPYNYEEVKVASPAAGLRERVMDVIKRDLDNPEFGVDDLSREVGMSRVHLNRKLKEVLGISPSSLIKSTRMKQAAYLLVHDNVNISEVAYRVGFSTPSYFSNSFRSYFGLSPKEFVAKYSDVTDRETLDKLFQ